MQAAKISTLAKNSYLCTKCIDLVSKTIKWTEIYSSEQTREEEIRIILNPPVSVLEGKLNPE